MSNEQPTAKKKVYRCWFDDPRGDRNCTDVPRNKGIDHFLRGIWVNDDLVYTGSLEDRQWIPPSRIVLVTVLEIDDEA
jgi:hypothetical protein